MKIELLRKHIFWYWRVMARNGEVLAHSEPYVSKRNAKKTAQRLGAAFKVKFVEP